MEKIVTLTKTILISFKMVLVFGPINYSSADLGPSFCQTHICQQNLRVFTIETLPFYFFFFLIKIKPPRGRQKSCNKERKLLMIWVNYDPEVQRKIRLSVSAMASKQIWGQPEEMQEGKSRFPLIRNNNNTICLKYVHGRR